jgi:nucleotide-binding universal stress UspA family protein
MAELDYAALNVYIEASRDVASDYLEGVAKRLQDVGHTVTWEVTEGIVADRINAAAESHGAGMIVMSTHGRTGLGRVFIGSVAERVIHDAARPVLLVHPGQAG